MDEAFIDELTRRMEGTIEGLRRDFAGLRTGRASPRLLEPIQVSVYGVKQPVSQLGTIGVPEPRILSIQVWDKAAVRAIDSAIREANLGLNPQIDGQMIRIPIPEMTQERRRELGKIASKYGEGARVSIRNLRREGMDLLKRQERASDISQDEQRSSGNEIQGLTDQYISTIDSMLVAKEQDIKGDTA